MPSANESSYAHTGIYRHTFEDILFTPRKEVKKPKFADENLLSLKKVSKLVQKFENGNLEETLDPSIAQQENEEEMVAGPTEVEISKVPVTVTLNDSVEETPILRTVSRQVSGASFIESQLEELNAKPQLQSTPIKTPVPAPRSNTLYDNASWESSSSPESRKSQVTPQDASPDRTSPFDFCYSKFARAQVHHKFEEYHKWDSKTLRLIASSVSNIRLEALNKVDKDNTDNRISILKSIYGNCVAGGNKELDALCCSLFDLLDDVHEQCLSIHEEYVAVKYSRRVSPSQ